MWEKGARIYGILGVHNNFLPNLVEQFFKIQFAFKAFLFYFLLFSHSPGIQINVSGVVFSGCNFFFFINLDFGNNFCGKSIRDLESFFPFVIIFYFKELIISSLFFFSKKEELNNACWGKSLNWYNGPWALF